jgi:Protein of unknown function (DUF3795)
MIAPCGINCGTCIAHLRNRNKCCGCRPDSGFKVNHCSTCRIRNCEYLSKTGSKFCYDCEIFPCLRLKQIDKRYRIKYKTGLIQNLIIIKEIGIYKYLKNEIARWSCPNCGSLISVHRDNCLTCNLDLNKNS